MDIGRGNFHVDQKVGPGKTEQGAEIIGLVKQGIDFYMAALGMRQGNGKGVNRAVVNKTANGIGSLVAKKQRVKYMYLAIGPQTAPRLVRQALAQQVNGPACQQAHIGGQVCKGGGKTKISQ